MKDTQIACFIVAFLMKELPKEKRNVATCEKIFDEALKVLKSFTFSDKQE